MARYYGLRFGLIGAVLALCTIATASTASSAHFDNRGATLSVTASPYDQTPLLIMLTDHRQIAFDISAAVEPAQISRGFPGVSCACCETASYARGRAPDLDRRLEVRPGPQIGGLTSAIVSLQGPLLGCPGRRAFSFQAANLQVGRAYDPAAMRHSYFGSPRTATTVRQSGCS